MRQKNLQKGLSALVIVFCVFCAISNTYGSGFAIYTQGASALGQGNATIAHTDDPTAIFYNPALINTLEGTQIEAGTTLLFPSRKFRSDSGKAFRTEPDVLYPSTLFVTHSFNNKISAGLDIFNPFGLRNKWPDNWEGRYIATNSEMTTYNINPVFSYRLTPYITLAAGVDFLLLDATLEKKLNLSSLGLPDANQKFDGNGNGIGYNVGILIEPHRNISIGASYRSEIDVDIDGDATFELPVSFLRQTFPNTSGNTDITLPQQILVGICYKGFSPLTFEVAFRWEGWSSYDQLKINLDKPVGPTSTKTFFTPKDWRDTSAINFGVKYQLNDTVALLAGYLNGGNPVPDNTFEPSIPDANTQVFSVGTDIKTKKLKIDLAYAFQTWQGRKHSIDDNPDVANPTGRYDTHTHMVGVSLTYTF